MLRDVKKRRETTGAQIPEEVWVDILNRLTLTDLVFVSKASKNFEELTKLTIKRYRRHDSPFTSNSEFSYDSVPIEPDISPESGVAVCFQERTNTFKILNMDTAETVASSPGTNCYPVSLQFSKKGNFIAVTFDSKFRIYALDLAKRELTPYKEVRFHVPITDYVPPGHGRCRFGMGRMLVSFSADDKKLAVAHISESQGSTRHVIFKCLRASLQDSKGKQILDFERLRRSSGTEETMIVYFKVHRDPISFWSIELNAEPLRFYIPPGCIHEHGFLLDPTMPHAMLSRRILDFDLLLGSLVRCCFSSCGQYFFEAWHGLSCVTSRVTIRKFHVATLLPTNIIKIPMFDFKEVLAILISNDGSLAVILQGELKHDSSVVTAWHAANLCGVGHISVLCKEPIHTTQYDDFTRTFNLSDDGQLLSISCDLKGENHYNMVKVFETASGLCIDAMTCAVPSEGHLLSEEWHAGGRTSCHHVFAGRRQTKLTLFTLGDENISFAHAS